MNTILQKVTARITEPSSLGGLAVLLDVALRNSNSEPVEATTGILSSVDEVIMFVLGLLGVLYPEGTPALDYLTQKHNVKILGEIIVVILAVSAIGVPEKGNKSAK